MNDLWMARITLGDTPGQRFYSEERLNRSGPGVAGVDAQSGLVWNANWQAHISEQVEELRGVADKFSLALQLSPVKQPVVQGQDASARRLRAQGMLPTTSRCPASRPQGPSHSTARPTRWREHPGSITSSLPGLWLRMKPAGTG